MRLTFQFCCSSWGHASFSKISEC